LGRTTAYHHEGRGGLKRITRQINPDGSEEHFQYDGAGRRIAATDPLGRTIHWRYDGQGNLLGVQGSDGRSSQQRWGLPGTAQDGLLLQSASASGIHTHYAYDEWGRLTEVTVLAGELASTTRLQYQEGAPHTLPPANRAWVDQPQAVIDPRGGRKTLGYNACGQPTRYTDCSGHTTRWQYDAWGELIEETDALGHHTRHQRGTVGGLLQTQKADGSLVQYRWGDNGQVQAITLGAVAHRTSDTGLAPVTTTVTYEYDLWGRIIAQTQAGASLQLRYDSAGRVTELLNENHATTRFTYDSQDRLIQEVVFDGRSQAYRYDAAGQLIEKTDSQDSSLAAATEGMGTVRSRFHYDNAGRLTYRITAKAGAACEVDISPVKAEAPDNDLQIHQFSYSDSGELLSTEGRKLGTEATTALVNDWLQLSTEQLRTVLNQQHDTQALANSPWLQSLQVRYLQPRTRVDLQRDALGRTTGEVQTLYCVPEADTNRTQALHIDGSITHLHYDSLHQLRQAVQRNPQGQELSRTTYRYDAFGRRVSKTHRKTREQGQITHFGWDGDRLVHTETAYQIHHTVYEPGSFVPLLQVQRRKENAGQTDPVKTLLGLGSNDASNALERELPREERELLHQALKEALQPGYQLSGLLPQELQA
jgi:YD repeat-containing protein